MGDGVAPPWFVRAIETPYREQRIQVAGSEIRYLDWGEPGRPGLIFVHGGAAHAHWWSFIAPMFTRGWHAVALDLSGHGESGRRTTYNHTLWSEEVLAVADDADFPGPPVVVGHSLGGGITLELASAYGDRLAGAVVVDTLSAGRTLNRAKGPGARRFAPPARIRMRPPHSVTSGSFHPSRARTHSSSITSADSLCTSADRAGRGDSIRISSIRH